MADPSPAPRSTSTRWPWAVSSRTPSGVIATRFSAVFTSAGTPTIIPNPLPLMYRSATPAGHLCTSGEPFAGQRQTDDGLGVDDAVVGDEAGDGVQRDPLDRHVLLLDALQVGRRRFQGEGHEHVVQLVAEPRRGVELGQRF